MDEVIAEVGVDVLAPVPKGDVGLGLFDSGVEVVEAFVESVDVLFDGGGG